MLQDINIMQQEAKIDLEKIKINEKIKNDQQKKINLLKEEQEKIKNEKNINEKNNSKNNFEKNKKMKNKLNKKIILFFILIILINILQYIFVKNKILKNIFLLTVPTYLIFSIFLKNKLNKKIKKDEKNKTEENKIIENKILEIENEINLIEKNKNEIENEIKKIKNENNLKIKNKIEKIKNKYKKSENEINKKLLIENINEEINFLQQEKNKKEIEIANLKIKKSIKEETNSRIEKLEEEKVMLTQQYVELCKKNDSIKMAKDAIEKSYEIMKKSVSPKFTEQLCDTISRITNSKHKIVKTTDNEGLVVELENGNYVNANRLSIGTIDQLYLSLRLAVLEEISTEKVPIILDEAFAYYDDERLKNILEYLIKEFSDRQILIFTCTKREEDILKSINAEYNLVVL